MSTSQITKFRENRIKSLNSMNIDDVELISFNNYVDDENENANVNNENNNQVNQQPETESTYEESSSEKDSSSNEDEDEMQIIPEDPLPEVLPVSNVVKPVNNITERIVVRSIDDISIFSNINNNNGNIFKNDDKCKKVFILLSAWFKYGYYKSNDTSILRKKVDDKSLNGFLYEADFSIDIRNNYICGIIKKDNHELIVPLFNKPDGIYTKFEIKVDPFGKIESHKSGKYINITENGIVSNYYGDGFTCFINPIILHVDGADVIELSQSERKDSENFVIRNEGKTFIVVSSDPFVTDEDFKNFLQKGEISLDTKKKSSVTR